MSDNSSGDLELNEQVGVGACILSINGILLRNEAAPFEVACQVLKDAPVGENVRFRFQHESITGEFTSAKTVVVMKEKYCSTGMDYQVRDSHGNVVYKIVGKGMHGSIVVVGPFGRKIACMTWHGASVMAECFGGGHFLVYTYNPRYEGQKMVFLGGTSPLCLYGKVEKTKTKFGCPTFPFYIYKRDNKAGNKSIMMQGDAYFPSNLDSLFSRQKWSMRIKSRDGVIAAKVDLTTYLPLHQANGTYAVEVAPGMDLLSTVLLATAADEFRFREEQRRGAMNAAYIALA